MEVHEEDDRELEPLGGMHRHQVDGASRLDDGVRLVTGAQGVEVAGQAPERRIAPAFDAPDERAHLLHVLARLIQPAPAELEGVRGLAEHGVDELARRNPIRELEPPRDARPARVRARPGRPD